MVELTPIIKESFAQYAGAVLQSRALVDVRDCLKPSARQVFYCLHTDKFTADKPFKKTLKCIGSAMRVYIHGDASCEGIIMRAGQPFSMRYPLVDVDGSYGNLMESGNWAAARYTSSRLSKLSGYLFSDIEKETISEWRDNYDDTEQYPAVLPEKGFYNIVNGTVGIGVGAASSIPAFNLKEVNEALIKLLQDPDIDFDEIYCAPDFATGGILLNEAEVKESLRNGTGKSCKLRAVVEYDAEENCLVVKEMPYGVYTNTICKELDAILSSEDTMGIERHNDLTGIEPKFEIYLNKRANPAQVLKKLYKNTSLQSHFGINMTMLENGRFPRVFGWKEALQSHIDHEKVVYRRGYEHDRRKLQDRLHIVEGIIIALASIEEVIKTIKESASTSEANLNLQKNFLLDAVQARAVLEIKLSRLAHMEVEKFKSEKRDLLTKIEKIDIILNDENLFNQELIKGWREVAQKFGDARRTQIMNVESDDEEEPVEQKQMVVYLTNQNNLYAYEDSSLISQRRGGVGTKLKLAPGEMVISTLLDSNYNDLLLFSNKGKVYHYDLDKLTLNCKTSIFSLLEVEDGEVITEIASDKGKDLSDSILFVTKNGMVKRTKKSEFETRRQKGISAIKLKESDIIKNVFMVTDEDILGIATKNGSFVMYPVKDIGLTGRVTQGVKGITLRPEDEIIGSTLISKSCKEILTITAKGMAKKTPLSEFTIGSRGNKGVTIHKIQENDELAFVKAIEDSAHHVVVSSKTSCIKTPLEEIQSSSRNTVGTKAIKLAEENRVMGGTIE